MSIFGLYRVEKWSDEVGCGYGGIVWVIGEWAVGYWIVGDTSFQKIYIVWSKTSYSGDKWRC